MLFVRGQGLSQGRSCLGISSSLSCSSQGHLAGAGWGAFLRYDTDTPGSTPNPSRHTSLSHKRPPWAQALGRQDGPQPRTCPRWLALPRAPTPPAAQVGAFSAGGRVGWRGRGPEAKRRRRQSCCSTPPWPSWEARFRARRAESRLPAPGRSTRTASESG